MQKITDFWHRVRSSVVHSPLKHSTRRHFLKNLFSTLTGVFTVLRSGNTFASGFYNTGFWKKKVTVGGGGGGGSNEVWIWGYNVSGQLGVNDVANRSSPVMLSSAVSWLVLSASFQFMAGIKSDRTLWAWGCNTSGQLGLNDLTNRSSPIKVGADTDWAGVACGQAYTMAVKTDGTLWTWGLNSSGQLGLRDVATRSSPAKVGAATDWSPNTRHLAPGATHTLAIKTDGTLWAWGLNTSGQLGLRDVATRSSPAKVGAGTTWSTVATGLAFSAASTSTNTLWTWGMNESGQLGLRDVAHRSSPAQVGAGIWSSTQLALGDRFVLAMQTGNSIWSWGHNSTGQLGLNDVALRSSPIQIGADTNWSAIVAGVTNSWARKSDGTIWAWGDNSAGQLATGVAGAGTQKSSPNQVGALTTWSSIFRGQYNGIVLK